MAGLTDRAGGDQPRSSEMIDQAHKTWEESMFRRLKSLRDTLQGQAPEIIADRCGAIYKKGSLILDYWDKSVSIVWPNMDAFILPDRIECSTFDTAMLLYYLSNADGTAMADRWIGFRELPDGGFYHQAYQGYSGDLIANAIGEDTTAFERASRALDGRHLPALASHAYAFQPLPRIRLAAVLWLGDDEFSTRASVLFDAAASHYMTTDGLALLGSGLTQRLIRAAKDVT